MIWLKMLPWRLIGMVGVILLVMAGAIYLMNYGQKLERALGEVERLEGELEKANGNTETCLTSLDETEKAELRWQDAAANFEIEYRREMERRSQPRIIYREAAATVPIVVPVGDCDRAAVAAWDVLRAASVVGRDP